MEIKGTLCPFGDGRHQLRPWEGGPIVQGRRKAFTTRSGFACRACHKTWEWVDADLVPTWGEDDDRRS